MNNFDYKNMTPFKWFVLENFPFIENDFDAINNYHLFSKVVEYLNNTIDNVNVLGNLVEQFSNYFDNLDVQEEINNKLDEMAQDGTLQEIIANYLNSKAVFGFDNVEAMKNATNLINGSYAKTLGFYNKNDGGMATYKIRTITNEDIVDNMTIIPLNNSLIAELIFNDNINILQLGAYKNQEISSSDIINNAIILFKGKSIFFPEGKYYISTPIKTYSSNENFTNLFFDTHTELIPLNTMDCILDIGGNDEYFSYEVGNKKYINGGILNATNNVNISAIKINQKIKDLELSQMQIYTNCNGIIIGDDNSSSQDLYIHHIIINHNTISNNNVGITINSNDNSISDCRVYFNKKAVVCNGGSTFLNNIHTLANNLQNDSISFEINSSLIFLDNCYGDSEDTFLKINGSLIHPYIIMSNCEYYSYKNNQTTMFDIETYARLKISNLYIHCREGNEHIGIKCPYDSLEHQLSEEMLDVNGLSIENAENMRNGDILKGLTSAKKGKPSFTMMNNNTPMDKNEWYVLGYFPIKNYIFNNINLVISNRKSNYPISISVNANANLNGDIGVGIADTVDNADYQIGYKVLNTNFDVNSDYPRVCCYFKQTSNQNRWLQDIELISNKIIPIATNTNRGTQSLQKATDNPTLIYSITGSSKAINLVN